MNGLKMEEAPLFSVDKWLTDFEQFFILQNSSIFSFFFLLLFFFLVEQNECFNF